MWLLVLIGVIIYFVIVNAAEKSSGDKAYQSLVEREGIYLPRSYEREKELWSEIWENWYRGDKSLFPNEYIGYFASVENKALYSYIGALRDMQLVMEGFSPVDNNRVKPETYNSIKNFDIRWGDRIREFNIKAAEERIIHIEEEKIRQDKRYEELRADIARNVSYYTGAPLDLDTVECLKRRPNNESQT